MSVLFLSHSSRTDNRIESILEVLRKLGHEAVSVFVDHGSANGIIGGEPWEERLYTELRRCRALIALVDCDWLSSKWCVAEANHAQALRKPVIPIYLEDFKTDQRFAELLSTNAPPVFARVQALTRVKDIELRLGRALADLGLDAKDIFTYRADRAPYPGLFPFEKDDASVFFGREQEITDLLAVLNSCRAANRPRWVTIQGASGSGKSSLLRAGLLPRLERDKDHWIIIPPFRPLSEPLKELQQALASVAGSLPPAPSRTGKQDETEKAWASWIMEAAASIRSKAQRQEATVLIFVDQLEEAVNREQAETVSRAKAFDEASAFLVALREALALSDHRLLVISTLRADTIGAFQRHRALRERASSGDIIRERPYQLGSLPKSSFFAIIEGPAALAGLQYDNGLVGRMVDETATDDALPLLAFALRELWDKYGEDLRITEDEYKAFGGIEKAVGDRAEAEFSDWTAELTRTLGKAECDAHIDLFRQTMFTDFVSFTDDERLIRVPVAWSDIPERLKKVIEAFRDARLMSADAVTVEVAHDALFRRWEQLSDWRKQAGSALVDLRLVRRMLAERMTASDLIPEGYQLDQATRLLASGWIETEGKLAEFINASVERAKRHRWLRHFWKRLGQTLTVATALIVVIATALFFYAANLQHSRLDERDRAFTGRSILGAILSRTELAGDNVRTAVELALEGLPDPSHEDNSAGWLRNLFEHRPLPVSKVAAGALMEALLKHPLDQPWLIGHGGSVLALAWSPDGKFVATGAADKTARIWNAQTGEQLYVLEGHTGSVSSIKWTPDGTRLVTSSTSPSDGTARVWDATTRKQIAHFAEDDGYITRFYWSPDVTQVMTLSSTGTMRVWDVATGSKKSVSEGNDIETIRLVIWSPEGGKFAIMMGSNRLQVWDTRASGDAAILRYEGKGSLFSWSPIGQRIAIAAGNDVQIRDAGNGREMEILRHDARVASIAWGPDASRLTTTSRGRTGRIWRLGAIGFVQLNTQDKQLGQVTWSPDGTKLAASSSADRTVFIWNATDGQVIAGPFSYEHRFVRLSWSPDSKYLAASPLAGGDFAHLWEVATGRSKLLGHQNRIMQALWGQDSKRIATVSSDGTGRIWNVEGTGTAIVLSYTDVADDDLIIKNAVKPVAWSSDGSRLATAWLGDVHVWDVKRGQRVTVLTPSAELLTYFEWNQAGTRIATASADGAARIWDATHGSLLNTLQGHTEQVNKVTWRRDGMRVATASDDKTVRVWDAATGRELVKRDHSANVLHVAWSPDGKRLVIVAVDQVYIWDPETGEPIKLLEGHAEGVVDAAWSPEGKRLATASADDTARIWDVATGKEITRPITHDDDVVRVSWSADGKFLATASNDRKVQVWDSGSGQRISALKGYGGDIASIDWNADGRLATASSDETVRIWDPTSGREVTRYNGRQTMAAWDPAGRLLAAPRSDGAVEINFVPREDLNVWLTCALGQVPSLSQSDDRDNWNLEPKPQLGSAATLIDRPFADRRTAARQACDAFLR